LITHHISKGETVAQSLKDRFDYGQNPEKTQGGELISAYECDHRTADAEFLLAKAKYKAVTGREVPPPPALVSFCITYPASKAIEAIERRMRRGDKQ